ncbi:MAG: energy-coupling factor transporter transmembrane component T [Peptostreptococcaceae bacterium]|nr:energy-coupling factor transporter transmembrane component T [Peptostreptococcaceae bacterium]
MNKRVKINALVLLGINLLIPLLVLVIKSDRIQPFLFGFASLLLLYYGKLRRWFMFLIAFVVLGFLAMESIKFGNAFMDLMAMTFFIFYRFIPMLMIGSMLFFDYHTSEILSSLQAVYLPRKMVIAITIAIRYIPTFREEFRLIKNCMRLRGIEFSWRRPIQSFSYFITPQLFRCALLAEELTAAGLTKGIDSPCRRTSIFEYGWHWYDTMVSMAFILGAVLTAWCEGVIG